MTTTAAPATATSCAILASDFSPSTADALRDRWTAGKMRLLIAALGDTPVAIVLERTGFAMVGVTLERVAARMNGGQGVVIRDAAGRETNYRLDNVGTTIIPLAETRAKWEALKAGMDLTSALARKAKEIAEAEGFEGDGGAWVVNMDTLDPAAGRGEVSYRPRKGFGSRWYRWVTV